MKTAGIVAEYNPMHNGHIYHIEKTRESTGSTHIVTVLSSNFLQRGEAAMFSKWARAGMAIRNGSDLVIELPTFWSMSYAQRYSAGAVALLNGMGCIDYISFGSECGSTKKLEKCCRLLNDSNVCETVRNFLGEGLTFADARTKALQHHYGNEISEILKSPNNNLALEYINALINSNSEIEPVTVKRTGPGHESFIPDKGLASASYIRNIISENSDFSEYTSNDIKTVITDEINSGKAPCLTESLETAILSSLRMMSPADFAQMPDISEGIEYRIYEAAQRAASLEELYSLIKTKRYTLARIRRIVLSSFLKLYENEYSGTPPYIKVLAMNGKGKEILAQIKRTGSLPVITKRSDTYALSDYAKKIYNLEQRVSDVYALSSPFRQKCGRDQTEKLIVIG